MSIACSPKVRREIHHVRARTVNSASIQAPAETSSEGKKKSSKQAFAKTSSEGKKNSCKYHFVVHIGPPKSGSTAVQEFLFHRGAWIEESFGIFTGNLKLAKAPFAIIRVVQGNKEEGVVGRAEKILEDINSRLGTSCLQSILFDLNHRIGRSSRLV